VSDESDILNKSSTGGLSGPPHNKTDVLWNGPESPFLKPMTGGLSGPPHNKTDVLWNGPESPFLKPMTND
jgi:hypothetical protein